MFTGRLVDDGVEGGEFASPRGWETSSSCSVPLGVYNLLYVQDE